MSAPDVGAKTEAENVLNSSLRSLFAVAENYPELKANQNFLDLQNRISALEESIADRREFFNEATTIYNTKIQSFPDMFFANMLQMLKRPLLEIPKAETEDVKISFS
jgi:LemA protein